MIQYILEIIAFQLLFLVVYDLFLKQETFFQWNRFYLIGTFVLSLVLPWIKIEAFKTMVTQEFVGYPVLFWQLDGIAVTLAVKETNWLASLSTEYIVFGIGTMLATLLLLYKLLQIYWLKEKGSIRYYNGFTKVVVKKSELVFSFFKHIFLGEFIKKENEANIIAHELVHIKQWHTLDLLFFEVMRILFWFNPLVYVYQNRVSELHEFIADSIVAKDNKKEQYQTLLAEVFQTQNISFVNQFCKSSLIKKRIIMLSKEESKKVYQFKYLLLVPLLIGMLVYTSCEVKNETKDEINNIELVNSIDEEPIPFAIVQEAPIFPGCESASDKKACFKESIENHIRKHFNFPKEAQELGIQGRVSILFTVSSNGTIKNIRKRGPHEFLENEAVRIIERLPQMQPGRQDGKAVDVPFAIPITFKLN
ncbi:TonB family protein [uncultured Croceitalea sp.]|uniref:TonB family protein n=1 Tax=uncultured Croceitalea sp. TaxID=1798908 RepID=UPI00374E7BA2